MAGKDIRSRMRSMESTKQITGAMELVAASKLRTAREGAAASRPHFEALCRTVHDIAERDPELSSPYVREARGDKTCFVVIAGDRGLAGGYNGNVLKLALAEMEGREAVVLPIGKKTAEFFRGRDIPLLNTRYPVAEAVNADGCSAMAKDLCERFLAGQFHRVVLCYTDFVSALTQTPAAIPLLPIIGKKGQRRSPAVWEPDSETVLRAIVPHYLGGVIYGALRQSLCSEQAARRTAMDSATQNAEELIETLNLQYNRARQGAITREITEIVAGAEH